MKRFSAILIAVLISVPLLAQSVQNIEQPARYKVIQKEITLLPESNSGIKEEGAVLLMSNKSNAQIESLGGESRLGWTRSNSQIANLGDTGDSRLGWTRSNSQVANLGDTGDSRLGWTRSNSQVANLGDTGDSRLGWTR